MVQDGLFLFNPARHDYGDKQFLGHRIAGAGLAEVDQAVDLLARHPATAHFISAKLAAYFLGDAPPPALVDRMARTFLASDGDIAAVLQTLYASPEFARSLDAGVFKDPVHYVYSSLRLAYAGMPTIVNPRPALNLLRQLGQPLNQRLTPDGYPLAQSDWAGPGQMTARFETARAIAAAPPNFYRDPAENPQQQQQQQQQQTPQPPSPRLPDLLKAYAGTGLFDRLSPDTRQALAQAATPATPIPTCWPRRNSCGASPRPHNTAPSAPEILMHRRRLLQLMAAAPSRWAPAASTPRRPRGTTGCWSCSCAAPTTQPACWCRPPATSTTSRGPPSPSRAQAAAPTPRCRWPTAGRCIPRWPPA